MTFDTYFSFDISGGFEGVNLNGPVAQLVRAPPCHGGGREFESHLGRLYKKVMCACAQTFLYN